MKPVQQLVRGLCMLGVLFLGPLAQAGDLDWSGLYRVEGYHLSNLGLNNEKREKDYGLQHLILKPKIVAADGLTINGRFDILNGDDYENSQVGQVFGYGVGNQVVAPTNALESSSLSENQKSDSFKVTLLYLTFSQEFGSLIVGRAPLHFGLGMTHNAGNEKFDHWYDNRDMVGYRVVMGNFYIYPMMAKVSERKIDRNDDVTDFIIHLQYENPDTDLEMGVIYQKRASSTDGNDAPVGSAGIFGDAASIVGSGLDLQVINLYSLKDTDRYRLGVEAGFVTGKTGVRMSTTGANVSINAIGLAFEAEYRPEASKYKFGAKLGYASGDDPESEDQFDGFLFDRNYNTAFLMFNHSLGSDDFLRSKYIGGGTSNSSAAAADSPVDNETISNVMYLSPYIKYQWKDQWELEGILTTGWINQDFKAGENNEIDLGYELDFGINFMPNERVTWLNQIALIFPGSAFEGGDITSYESKFAYGIMTKAAISF